MIVQIFISVSYPVLVDELRNLPLMKIPGQFSRMMSLGVHGLGEAERDERTVAMSGLQSASRMQ